MAPFLLVTKSSPSSWGGSDKLFFPMCYMLYITNAISFVRGGLFFCVPMVIQYKSILNLQYIEKKKRTTGTSIDPHCGHCTGHSSNSTSRPHNKALRTRTCFSDANTLPLNRASHGPLTMGNMKPWNFLSPPRVGTGFERVNLNLLASVESGVHVVINSGLFVVVGVGRWKHRGLGLNFDSSEPNFGGKAHCIVLLRAPLGLGAVSC